MLLTRRFAVSRLPAVLPRARLSSTTSVTTTDRDGAVVLQMKQLGENFGFLDSLKLFQAHFEENPHTKSAELYGEAIKAYSELSQAENVESLFEKFSSNQLGYDNIPQSAYNSVLTMYDRLNQPQKAMAHFEEWKNNGVNFDVSAYATMNDIYNKAIKNLYTQTVKE